MPFVVDYSPINDAARSQGAALSGLSGLAEGIKAGQVERVKSAKEASTLFAQQQVTRAIMEGDTEAIQEAVTRNPDLIKFVDSTMKWKNEQTKQNAIQSAHDILINGADPVKTLLARADMVIKAGGTAEDTLRFAEQAMKDPEDARKKAETILALYDPAAFESYNKTKGTPEAKDQTATRKDYESAKKDGYAGSFIEYQNEAAGRTGQPKTELTASQKDYEYAKKDGFTGSFMDFKQAVTGEGPKTALEMAKLNVQILDIQDKMQGRAEAKKEIATLADKKTKSLIAGADSVIEEINRAITRSKSPTATGVIGAVTSGIPASPAYNLKKNVDTVKANLGFDKLQSMRDSSPTGGALGQVSERELSYLQATITALDPNMGEEALLVALEKVKRHYENWRETMMGRNPDERVIGTSAKFGKVTEGDIQATIRANTGMTREQVLTKLELQ
jgi:hypothetical protein